MTIKELIEKLKSFDENITVLVDTEGSPLEIKDISEDEFMGKNVIIILG